LIRKRHLAPFRVRRARPEPLLHPVVDHRLAADSDGLRRDDVKAPGREHRTGGDAGLGIQARQRLFASRTLDVLEQSPCHPAALKVRMDVEQVDVPVGFQVREARDPTFDLGDPGRFARAALAEPHLIDER